MGEASRAVETCLTRAEQLASLLARGQSQTPKAVGRELARNLADLRAALSSAEPGGWRLVPVEMTDEMRFVWASMDGNPADAQWAAVLAAASNPPSPENVG